jgi:toxin ParE1/3/4
MAEYRLSPAAERDLEGIWKYTRREWGLEQAERYTDLLTAAFQVLSEAPKSAPACDHIRPGYRRRKCRAAYDLFPSHRLRHRDYSHPS